MMGADSRGHTAQALWSAFARRTLWPDSRSGGPDLWRRLRCYPRFRDQAASGFPSVQRLSSTFSVCACAVVRAAHQCNTRTHYRTRTHTRSHTQERCEEVSVCAAKAAFNESLLSEPGFAEVRASHAELLRTPPRRVALSPLACALCVDWSFGTHARLQNPSGPCPRTASRRVSCSATTSTATPSSTLSRYFSH